MTTLDSTSASHPTAQPRGADMRAVVLWLGEAAFFVFLALALFRSQLFENAFVPFDFIEQHWFFLARLTEEFKHEGITQWTRQIMSGYPSIGDPLFARFYPPNILIFVLSPRDGLPLSYLHWNLALHCAAAGIFASLLARDLVKNRLAAILAGVVYGFGGFIASHAQSLGWMNAVPWIPLALWAARRALLRRSPEWTVVAGVAFGLIGLAGHAQTTLYAAYTLAAWSTGVWLALGTKNLKRFAAAYLGATSGALVAGIALAAVVLLPAARLAGASSRSVLSYFDASVSSLHPTTLLTLIFPTAFGHGGNVAYWAPGDIAETYLYVGIAPLVLTATCLVARRQAIVWLVSGLAVLSLLLSLGEFAPVHRLAYEYLPGFTAIRRPAGGMLFFFLWLSMLAAMGYEALLDRRARPGRAVAVALGAAIVASGVLAAAALSGWLPLGALQSQQAEAVRSDAVRLALVSAACIAAVALMCYAPRTRTMVAIALVIALAAEVEAYGAAKGFNHRTDVGYNRVIGQHYIGDRHSSAAVYIQSDPDFRAGSRQRVDQSRGDHLWLNGTAVLDLDATWGYSVLRLREYERFVSNVPSGSPAYRLLAAKYVITGHEAPAPAGPFVLVLDDFAYKVYLNTAALPRAFVVGEAVVESDSSAALIQLNDPSFDPARRAIVPEALQIASGADTSQAQVRWEIDEGDRLRLKVASPQGGLLVLSDPYYPGWTATVDGAPVGILRTNLAFRGVPIPAGEHTVEFLFRDDAFVLGALISSAAVGFLVLLLITCLFFRRGERTLTLTTLGLLLLLCLGTAIPWARAPLERPSMDKEVNLLDTVNTGKLNAPAPTLDVTGKRYGSLLHLETANEWRTALFLHPPASLEIPVTLAGPSHMDVGLAVYKNLWDYTDGVTFVARLRQNGAEREVLRRTVNPKSESADRRWLDLAVPLGGVQGEATLVLSTEAGPAGDTAGDWALWGPITIRPSTPGAPGGQR